MSEVHKTASRRERMNELIAKYADKIQGGLSGFDRLVFRGSLRKIAYVFGMKGYLWANQVLLKDFGAHVQQISERVKEASLQCVLDAGRVVRYLQSSQDDKEAIARRIAREQKITQGVVCALTCVEPCCRYGRVEGNPPATDGIRLGIRHSSKPGNEAIGFGATIAPMPVRVSVLAASGVGMAECADR